jgi:fatty-acid desaturase
MYGPPTRLDRWLWRRGILDQTRNQRVNRRILATIAGMHFLALAVCVPWLFSWSGAASAFAGVTIFGTLGINIGFHRLLTHRGFECLLWLEHALAVLGVCCMQGTPMSWVATHRKHHQHSDDDSDPHSPRAGFFWSHCGWFLVTDSALYSFDTYDRFARDLFRDRFYKLMEKPATVRKILGTQWAIFFTLGALVGGMLERSFLGALQLGLSWLAWGVVVRTVAVWHITWSTNSLVHIWGYRNYATDDDSRNNCLLAIVSNGEGWHNNHHAEPRSAAHGHRWWEFDLSFAIIWGCEMAGLAWNVVRPSGRRSLQPAPEPLAEPTRRAA